MSGDYPLRSQDVNGRQMVVVPSEVKTVERGAQQAFAVLSREEIARRRSKNEKEAAQPLPAIAPASAPPQSFAILSRAEIVRRRHESERPAEDPAQEQRVQIAEPPRRRGRPPKQR